MTVRDDAAGKWEVKLKSTSGNVERTVKVGMAKNEEEAVAAAKRNAGDDYSWTKVSVSRVDESLNQSPKSSIDSMSEQLNSIGQTAKAIVERFAPRADATIYAVLKDKLGREPTNAELKAEVQRIKEEALVETAGAGKLAHQKGRG